MPRPSGVRFTLVLAVLLLATACGEPMREDPPNPLRGRTFIVQRITERGAPMAILTGTSINLHFTADGRLVVNGGCNTMTGTVTLTGGRLNADLSSTEMACDEPRQRQDQWLSGVLALRPSWRLTAETLLLTTADTELELTSEQPVPLRSTTWTLTTLVDGQLAGAAPVAATFVFGEHEVTVDGLCNLHTVAYQQSGDTLTFELGSLSRVYCTPDIMKVENAATTVLNGTATQIIHGRTLTITNGTHGLQLTAD